MIAKLNLRGAYSKDDYVKLLKVIQQRIESLSTVKGGEYAHGNDRLDNFRRNAKNLGLPAEAVWAVYAAKHWDALNTYIKDMVQGTDRPRSEDMRERAFDLIVYLTLFIAMEDEKSKLVGLEPQ